jgi:hypothetical protein
MSGFAGLGQGAYLASQQSTGFPTTSQGTTWNSDAMNQRTAPLYTQAPAFGFSQMPSGTTWAQTSVAANRPYGFGNPPFATPYIPPQLVPVPWPTESQLGSPVGSRVASSVSSFSSPPASRIGSQTYPSGPPNGVWRLKDPDHPLPSGYGYIRYTRADGTPVEDWGEITRAGKDKAKWVDNGFSGMWAPGAELFGGRRKKRSTRRTKKKRNGVSRRARRRV